MNNDTAIKLKIAQYYSEKLKTFGATNRGVDWSSPDSQLLRFQQLSKIITRPSHFSIFDLGCGYGAYFEFLKGHYQSFQYYGKDISVEMIEAAKIKYISEQNSDFSVGCEIDSKTNFAVASGVFNVMLDHTEAAWENYCLASLDHLHQKTTEGFAFNCLTKYSDQEYMKNYLYYADPLKYFDYCKRNFSKDVALLHDYGLYEFTIIVRKSGE
jgi:SAM-dependent methyltransferase